MGPGDPNLTPGLQYYTKSHLAPKIPAVDRFLQGCAKLFGPRSVGRPFVCPFLRLLGDELASRGGGTGPRGPRGK